MVILGGVDFPYERSTPARSSHDLFWNFQSWLSPRNRSSWILAWILSIHYDAIRRIEENHPPSIAHLCTHSGRRQGIVCGPTSKPLAAMLVTRHHTAPHLDELPSPRRSRSLTPLTPPGVAHPRHSLRQRRDLLGPRWGGGARRWQGGARCCQRLWCCQSCGGRRIPACNMLVRPENDRCAPPLTPGRRAKQDEAEPRTADTAQP